MVLKITFPFYLMILGLLSVKLNVSIINYLLIKVDALLGMIEFVIYLTVQT